MKREAYAAARTVAPKLQDYFARHRDEAIASGQQFLARAPDAETIESIIDVAFWASLRKEEGYSPRISLAFLPPEEALHPLILERPLALVPDALSRVAPAVERPGIHLGFSRRDDELFVWGTTRTLPVPCFVLEVAAPGLLVVKRHSGEGLRKFNNVAVLEGDQIKIIRDGPSQLSVNVMLQLALSMRAHGRGGSLLIIRDGSDSWRESIVQPLPYAAAQPYRELANAVADAAQSTLDPLIAAIAGLTAVDGAVLLTDRFELLGFGAKIARRRGHPQVEQVAWSEPVEGMSTVLVHPERLGGTRHMSAAQFIQDQRSSVAFVASQDGHFTVFKWSPTEEMVHAHRVDALLL